MYLIVYFHISGHNSQQLWKELNNIWGIQTTLQWSLEVTQRTIQLTSHKCWWRIGLIFFYFCLKFKKFIIIFVLNTLYSWFVIIFDTLESFSTFLGIFGKISSNPAIFHNLICLRPLFTSCTKYRILTVWHVLMY